MRLRFEIVEDGTTSGDLGSFDGPPIGMPVGSGSVPEPYITKRLKKKKKSDDRVSTINRIRSLIEP